jgi:predicted nucleotidyltransferase
MKHHETALERYVARISSDDEVLAVIVSGSVARGEETERSDVDLYLVVTEPAWDRALANERIMYVDREDADYPGGYFDIKLATIAYLHDAVDHGDDPVRDSLLHSRVAFTRIPELEALLARSGDLGEQAWESRGVSSIAQVRLHAGYFLREGIKRKDPLLVANAALHTVVAADRALLALNRRLFAGPKYLRSAVESLPVRPEGWTELADRLLSEPGPETADALVSALEGIHEWGVSDELALSRFVLDNEMAWRTRVPVPEYR